MVENTRFWLAGGGLVDRAWECGVEREVPRRGGYLPQTGRRRTGRQCGQESAPPISVTGGRMRGARLALDRSQLMARWTGGAADEGEFEFSFPRKVHEHKADEHDDEALSWDEDHHCAGDNEEETGNVFENEAGPAEEGVEVGEGFRAIGEEVVFFDADDDDGGDGHRPDQHEDRGTSEPSEEVLIILEPV